MNIHNNARLTVKGRELLISRLERGEHPVDVASAMGVSVRTVFKWRKRFLDGELEAALANGGCGRDVPLVIGAKIDPAQYTAQF